MWFTVVCSLIDIMPLVVHKSTAHVKPHFDLLLHTISMSKNFLYSLQHASWKGVTHWHEQRCPDSYRQWQSSQSNCEIRSNCGEKPCDQHFPIRSEQASSIKNLPTNGLSTKRKLCLSQQWRVYLIPHPISAYKRSGCTKDI